MKRFTFAGIAVTALAVTTLGLAAPAVGAPSGTGSARDTINSLEAQGYRVITNKVGNAPLEQSTVVAVRPGREVTQRVGDPGGDGSVEKTLYTTVYVDVT
jgi:hypothetical protein